MKEIPMSVILLAGLTLLSGSFARNAYPDEIQYEQWESVLNTFVDDNGRVDYEGLKNSRDLLDTFIETQIENADLGNLSQQEQKAFWINAYNALTLRLIVDRYPLRFGGIRTINFGRPWSLRLKAAGKIRTLNEIEHEILRKWDPLDPRIHFAINCASGGCPKLPNTHFQPGKLDEQLDYETKRFINDKEKVRWDLGKKTLYHSAIFSWFKEDFLVEQPGILEYILKYINEVDRENILANTRSIKLKKLKYDWSLNATAVKTKAPEKK